MRLARSIKIFAMLAILAIFQTNTCLADPLWLLAGLQEGRSLIEHKVLGERDENLMVRQTSELTCGPAALATLLNIYYGENTSEKELANMTQTYERGTTTLLALRDAARGLGYNASGYKMDFLQLCEQIRQNQVPLLVHYVKPSLHYTLVIGVLNNRYILTADPSEGNIAVDVADFSRRWDGKVLVVNSSSHFVNLAHMQQIMHSASSRLDTLEKSDFLIMR